MCIYDSGKNLHELENQHLAEGVRKKFQEKYAFPFSLLADASHEISELFGVWQLKKFMGREFMGVVRTTFIFDENGICTRVIDKVKTKEASKQILEL